MSSKSVMVTVTVGGLTKAIEDNFDEIYKNMMFRSEELFNQGEVAKNLAKACIIQLRKDANT